MGKIITELPLEIIYLIIGHINELKDLKSFRGSDIKLLGSPVNDVIRKRFSFTDEHAVSALFWSTATGDEMTVRMILEKSSPRLAVKISTYEEDEEEANEEVLGSKNELSLEISPEKNPCKDEEEGTRYFVLGKKPTDDIVHRIMSQGADLLIAEHYQSSSFVRKGKILLEHSALSWSVKLDSSIKVKKFLEMGANPGLLDSHQNTVFDAVVRYAPVNGTLMHTHLREHEADFFFMTGYGGIPITDIDVGYKGRDGNTLLHLAVTCSQPIEMTQMVLDAGININVQNWEKKTALHLAFCHERSPPELIRLLLENGADTTFAPNHMIESWGWPKFHENIAVFLNLTEPSYRGHDGDTLLHVAIRCKMLIEDIELLLKRGVDANAKNYYSQTALHIVAGYGNQEQYDFLVDNGADITVKDEEGYTPAQRLAGFDSKGEGETELEELVDEGAKLAITADEW